MELIHNLLKHCAVIFFIKLQKEILHDSHLPGLLGLLKHCCTVCYLFYVTVIRNSDKTKSTVLCSIRSAVYPLTS
jgi:hypothetical protein